VTIENPDWLNVNRQNSIKAVKTTKQQSVWECLWSDYKAWRKCHKTTTSADTILLFWFAQHSTTKATINKYKQQLQICSLWLQNSYTKRISLASSTGVPKPGIQNGKFCGFRRELRPLFIKLLEYWYFLQIQPQQFRTLSHLAEISNPTEMTYTANFNCE